MNRSREEIPADMLSVAIIKPANKTAIMYRRKISHGQLKNYLSYMTDRQTRETTNEGMWATRKRTRPTLQAIN